MPLSLLNHSALALFAQRTRIPTSARSIGFCAIWVCISSSSIIPPPSKVETVHEIILKPDLSLFCVCFCIEESTPLFSLLGTPRQEAPLLLWCDSGVAPRWPQLRFSNVERRFRDELPASAVLRQGCPFRKGDRFAAVVHETEVLQMPFYSSKCVFQHQIYTAC